MDGAVYDMVGEQLAAEALAYAAVRIVSDPEIDSHKA